MGTIQKDAFEYKKASFGLSLGDIYSIRWSNFVKNLVFYQSRCFTLHDIFFSIANTKRSLRDHKQVRSNR